MCSKDVPPKKADTGRECGIKCPGRISMTFDALNNFLER